MRLTYLLLALLPLTTTAAQQDTYLLDVVEEVAGLARTEACRPDAPPDEPGTEALAGGSRAGKPFTPKGKQLVKQKNAAMNDGKNRCENCGVETVPSKKHEKDVTPPSNEAHVDHIVPKAKGGPGEPDNGQVLCRDCNLEKSDKAP
jgi:hypothetical protein